MSGALVAFSFLSELSYHSVQILQTRRGGRFKGVLDVSNGERSPKRCLLRPLMSSLSDSRAIRAVRPGKAAGRPEEFKPSPAAVFSGRTPGRLNLKS